MRPTVDELHTSGRYALIESFPIDEMNQFMMRELGVETPTNGQPRKLTTRQLLPVLVGGLTGAGLGYVIVSSILNVAAGGRLASLLWQLGGVVVALLVLVPIHEFIHGLAFRSIGAPRVGYGYSLKSVMVFAYSQLFPATMRETAFVALLPFLIITTGLCVGLVVWPAYLTFWLLLLLIHTAICMGDFALVRYYLKNRHRTIYTYDDVEGKRHSYFFAEV